MRALMFFFLVIVAGLYGKRFRCDYKYSKSVDGWIKYHPIPANWHEARLRCHLEGAKLASPLNEDLKAALRSFIPVGDECGVFTGIHATFSRGDFFSVEGVPLWKIPHKWAPDEPNNAKDEDNCILMTSEGELADVRCEETFPYMCYKKTSEDMVMNGCGTIDNEYVMDTRTGSCYKFHRVPRTWSRAYMTCAAEGGYLTIINSDTEAKVIADIFAKNPEGKMFYRGKNSALVGFHDWNEHGEWLTIQGQTLAEAGYAKFSNGEPNNATGGQFCGAVYRSALLDDIWCYGVYPFICEKSPDSLLCDDDQ